MGGGGGEGGKRGSGYRETVNFHSGAFGISSTKRLMLRENRLSIIFYRDKFVSAMEK